MKNWFFQGRDFLAPKLWPQVRFEDRSQQRSLFPQGKDRFYGGPRHALRGVCV